MRAVAPVLVRVTVCEGLAVLTSCGGKLMVDGVSDAALVVPAPESATVCGLLAVESVIVNDPLRAPVMAGFRVTEKEQEAPGTSEVPHVLLSAKSVAFVPVIAMFVMLSAAPSLLVRLVSIGAVVVPTVALPKFNAMGQTWAPGTNLDTKTWLALVWSVHFLHVGSKAPGVVGKLVE